MGLFDRFRKRPSDPLPAVLKERLAHQTESMTAREAAELAARWVGEIGDDAFLVTLSTADIDAMGSSWTWEVGFSSRNRLAHIWIEFDPEGVTRRAVPLLDQRPESFMPRLWETLDEGARSMFYKEWFPHGPLKQFKDSDTAVGELATNPDVNLVSGSTNVSLSTDRSGEQWVLAIGRREFRTGLRA